MSELKLERISHPDAASTSIEIAASGAVSFSNDIAFNTNTFYVDTANGRVGIGTTSPSHALTVQFDDQTTTAKFQNANTSGTGVDSAKVTIESISRDASLSITAQSSRSSFIDFGDEVNASRGRILYDHSDDHLKIQTAGSEAMRILSDSRVVLGKTTVDFDTVGIALVSDTGQVAAVRDGGHSLSLNRKTSDGEIARFSKDGTAVGSIGANSSQVYIAGTGVGLKCGTANLRPTNGSGSTSDNSVDLGSGSFRFKDLYLSGGVYLGGTGSANKLDDYEEGDWTPTMIGTTSGGGTVTSAQIICAKYTKIGNVVHLSVGLSAFDFPNSTTFVGSLKLGGLPFASTSRGNYEARAGDVYFFPSSQWDTVTNFTGLSAVMNDSSSTIGFVLKRVDDDRQVSLTDSNTNFSSGQNKYLRFNITYITDA